MRSTRAFFAIAVTIGLALPTAAAGQRPGHEHGPEEMKRPGPMAMHGPHMAGHPMAMMMTPGPAPAMLLHQKDVLGLDDDQVARLEALREDLAAEHGDHMERMMPLGERLHAAIAGETIDVDAYGAALRGMADEMIAMHVRHAEAARGALAVLTPDQREKVRYGMRLMHGMGARAGHGMMGPGMMGPGMMGPGMMGPGMMGGGPAECPRMPPSGS